MKYTWVDWSFSGFIAIMIVFNFISYCQINKVTKEIEAVRMEMVRNQLKEAEKPTHYLYDDNYGKVDCEIIDMIEDRGMVKVKYDEYCFNGLRCVTTKWLPKDKVYKYYTTEELSEIVNKKGGLK